MQALLFIALIVLTTIGEQEAHGMAEKRPPVEESQPAQPRKSDSNADQTALPIIIVETPDQATAAAKREQKADGHDAADLDAQIRAANAAERSAATAEWQKIPTLIISIAGTFIAVIALIFTFVSNRRSERIARAQTRAYLGVESANVTDPPDKPTHFSLTIKNSGNSPAMVTKLLFGAMFVQGKYDAGLKDHATQRNAGIIPPNGSLTLHAANTKIAIQGIFDAVKAGQFSAFVFLHVEYRDVFGDIQALEITRVAYKTDMRAGLGQDPDIPDKHYEIN